MAPQAGDVAAQGAGPVGCELACLLVSSPARGATMVRPGYAWAPDVTAGNHVQVVGPRRPLDFTRFISAPIFDLYTRKLHWGAQGGVTSAQRVLVQLSRGGDPAVQPRNVVLWDAWQRG
jgi:hypothetical protein